MSLLSKILGDPNKKIIKELENIVVQVNDLEAKFEKLNDQELKEFSESLNEKAQNNNLDELLVEAFALVR